jgi:carbon monoxide dehydrogenase subunit G
MRTLLLAALFWVTQAHASLVEVAVKRDGSKVTVDLVARADVSRHVAWSVLTDYERVASFTSGVKSSTVLARQGNRLQVEEKGEASFGPMRFDYETVRAIELIDQREIHSTLVRGDFKSYAFVTRLADAQGGGTSIRLHGEYESTKWIPPGVGPAKIEEEIRRHYEEVIAEMVKRSRNS